MLIIFRNLPKSGTEPTAVNTLNEGQIGVLVKNYEWVATMSNRLLDVVGSGEKPSSGAKPLVGI